MKREGDISSSPRATYCILHYVKSAPLERNMLSSCSFPAIFILSLFPLAQVEALVKRADPRVDTTLRLAPPSPPTRPSTAESHVGSSVSENSPRLLQFGSFPPSSDDLQEWSASPNVIIPPASQMPHELPPHVQEYLASHPMNLFPQGPTTLSAPLHGTEIKSNTYYPRNPAHEGEKGKFAMQASTSQPARSRRGRPKNPPGRTVWTMLDNARKEADPPKNTIWKGTGLPSQTELAVQRQQFFSRLTSHQLWKTYRKNYISKPIPPITSHGKFFPVSARFFQTRVDHLNNLKAYVYILAPSTSL